MLNAQNYDMMFLDAKHLYEALMLVFLSVCLSVFLYPFFENFQKHIQ